MTPRARTPGVEPHRFIASHPLRRLSRGGVCAWCFAFAVVCAPVALGCGPSLSQIERGQVAATENASHDEFLKAVLAARDEAQKAPEDEQTARGTLARALGLDPTTDAASTILAAGSRAKKLKDAGTLLHLTLAPQPLLVAQKSASAIPPNDEAVMKAFEESARSWLTLSRRFAALEARVEQLERQRTELSSQPEGRKGDMQRELAGAKAVLSEAHDTSQKYAGLMSRLLIDLASAVETGAADEALAKVAAPAKAPQPAARTKKPMRRPSGARPSGAAAAPAPAPVKRPPSDEFDP